MDDEIRTDSAHNAQIGDNLLFDILSKSLIRTTDTYNTPPQILWIDSSAIATLGNFSASTGKAKSKKTFNVSAIVAAALKNDTVLNYRACLPEGKQRISICRHRAEPFPLSQRTGTHPAPCQPADNV